MPFPKAYADAVQRLRVPGGFVLLGAFLALSRPSIEGIVWGLPISFAGIAIRSWAAGHLAKNEKLATSGPYGYVRNPLYLGSLFLAGGLVVGSRSVWVALVFATAFALIYLPVIQLEEEHLRKLFPQYTAYAKSVPCLWPRLTNGGSGDRFRSDLYQRNKERKALSGYAFALGWLFFRCFY